MPMTPSNVEYVSSIKYNKRPLYSEVPYSTHKLKSPKSSQQSACHNPYAIADLSLLTTIDVLILQGSRSGSSSWNISGLEV